MSKIPVDAEAIDPKSLKETDTAFVRSLHFKHFLSNGLSHLLYYTTYCYEWYTSRCYTVI